MASYNAGKSEIAQWARQQFPDGGTCLDVGACDGIWGKLLGDHFEMFAVEAWAPNVEQHHLRSIYKGVYISDIRSFPLLTHLYDLIIFGDVIEHMSADDARRVLASAVMICKDMIVSVPFQYKQGAIYGNPYEVHVQDDLTPEIFDERYPGFEILCRPQPNYAYYHLKGR